MNHRDSLGEFAFVHWKNGWVVASKKLGHLNTGSHAMSDAVEIRSELSALFESARQ